MASKLGTTIDWGGDKSSTWWQLVWYATRNSYYDTTAELKIAFAEGQLTKADYSYYKEMLFSHKPKKNVLLDDDIKKGAYKSKIEKKISDTFDEGIKTYSKGKLSTTAKPKPVPLSTSMIFDKSVAKQELKKVEPIEKQIKKEKVEKVKIPKKQQALTESQQTLANLFKAADSIAKPKAIKKVATTIGKGILKKLPVIGIPFEVKRMKKEYEQIMAGEHSMFPSAEKLSQRVYKKGGEVSSKKRIPYAVGGKVYSQSIRKPKFL